MAGGGGGVGTHLMGSDDCALFIIIFNRNVYSNWTQPVSSDFDSH